MRVWDIRRAVAALRTRELFGDAPISLSGVRDQAVNALYASLFIDGLAAVVSRQDSEVVRLGALLDFLQGSDRAAHPEGR